MLQSVGRIARANAFEVMFRAMMDDGEKLSYYSSSFIMLGAQKILRICCTLKRGMAVRVNQGQAFHTKA